MQQQILKEAKKKMKNNFVKRLFSWHANHCPLLHFHYYLLLRFRFLQVLVLNRIQKKKEATFLPHQTTLNSVTNMRNFTVVSLILTKNYILIL